MALRGEAQNAHMVSNEKTRIAAENKISKIVTNLHFLFEPYPDLTANQNCIQLQEEIVNTKKKLAFAKKALNDSIETYNATKKSFFKAVMVSLLKSKLDKQFEYWQLSQEELQNKAAYQVKL